MTHLIANYNRWCNSRGGVIILIILAEIIHFTVNLNDEFCFRDNYRVLSSVITLEIFASLWNYNARDIEKVGY